MDVGLLKSNIVSVASHGALRKFFGSPTAAGRNTGWSIDVYGIQCTGKETWITT